MSKTVKSQTVNQWFDSLLLTLSGTGHELHPDDWSVIMEAIQQHTAS
nr:hypothetical protein [Kamptonema animale]